MILANILDHPMLVNQKWLLRRNRFALDFLDDCSSTQSLHLPIFRGFAITNISAQPAILYALISFSSPFCHLYRASFLRRTLSRHNSISITYMTSSRIGIARSNAFSSKYRCRRAGILIRRRCVGCRMFADSIDVLQCLCSSSDVCAVVSIGGVQILRYVSRLLPFIVGVA